MMVQITHTSATNKLVFFITGVDIRSHNDSTYDTHLSHAKCAFQWMTFFCAVYLSLLLDKYTQTNSISERLPKIVFFADFFCILAESLDIRLPLSLSLYKLPVQSPSQQLVTFSLSMIYRLSPTSMESFPLSLHPPG